MHFEDISRDIRAAEAALRKLGDTIDAAIAARSHAPPRRLQRPPRRLALTPIRPGASRFASGRVRSQQGPAAHGARRQGSRVARGRTPDVDRRPEKRAYIRKNSADLENVRREQADGGCDVDEAKYIRDVLETRQRWL